MKSIKQEEIKPEVLKAYLDERVVGQETAKRALCVAVYNHYKSLLVAEEGDEEERPEKTNIFIAGPTGSGKTLMVKEIAKKLRVPTCSVSMTQMTQAGYVGDDVESALSALLRAADGNIAAAQMGIIFMDEADKVARKGDNPSLTRDVSGEGVQQGILKMIEGGIVYIPPHGGRKHPEQKLVPIDTTNILFIFGGAFEGIEYLIERRLGTRPLGFDLQSKLFRSKVDQEKLITYLSAEDLKAYGLIPELVGRIPIITYVRPLERDDLRKVLTEPKNALIKQYKKLFAMEGIELSFTERALECIVERALTLKLGARGLRTICETVLRDAMFSLPSQEGITTYTVDEDYVIRKLDLRYALSRKAA